MGDALGAHCRLDPCNRRITIRYFWQADEWRFLVPLFSCAPQRQFELLRANLKQTRGSCDGRD